MRSFTENMVILAVENQLMCEMPRIFTTAKIVRLDKDMLEKLAGESDDVRSIRQEIKAELASLKTGLELCSKWRQPDLKGIGKSQP